MASRIKAIKTLQASIQPRRTAKMRDLVEHMQRRTGLNKGEILQALLGSAIPWCIFTKAGRPQKSLGSALHPHYANIWRFPNDLQTCSKIEKGFDSGKYFGSINN